MAAEAAELATASFGDRMLGAIGGTYKAQVGLDGSRCARRLGLRLCTRWERARSGAALTARPAAARRARPRPTSTWAACWTARWRPSSESRLLQGGCRLGGAARLLAATQGSSCACM